MPSYNAIANLRKVSHQQAPRSLGLSRGLLGQCIFNLLFFQESMVAIAAVRKQRRQ